MQQFQAGYFLEAFNQKEYKPLIDALIPFDVSNFDGEEIEDYDSYCSVLNNILCRGLPTRPSIFIEQTFANLFGITEQKDDDLGAITFPLKNTEKDLKDRLYKALHIVEPRLLSFQNGEKLGSDEEANFIQKMLPNWLGGFWWQLLERQRKITSVSTNATDFVDQMTDFSLQLPYSASSLQGLVIEIDGQQHKYNPQLSNDKLRDNFFANNRWRTYRLPTDKFTSFEEHLKSIAEFQKNEIYLKTIKKNYDNKTFDEARLIDLQLALSPLAIARIQKVLLEYFLRNPKKCYNTEGVFRLAILERDVPCAALAVEDLKQQFENLFNLEGKGEKFTPIVLDIFTTTEFEKAQLHQLNKSENIKDIDPSVSYDLVIDIAMLQRTGFTLLTESISATHKIEIRSAHHKHSKRTFYTSSHIEYTELAIRNDDGTFQDVKKSEIFLTYFLQNIFRKTSFRTGQLPILHRALKGQSVIGLLPTGGGKSLTYQIAALLQPGVTLVIDPIKSLMKDQYDNLLKNSIDGCTYINSSLSTAEKRENVAKMGNGETIFTFVSPERLQMRDFRTQLDDMYNCKIYFSYCVIDEAHCVSEWGHDFRTSYLRLGENVLNFCKTKNKERLVPLFGLTATASFDVLADVQRELSGKEETSRLNESAIVRYETFNRKELNFKIVKVEADLSQIDKTNDWGIKESIGLAKQSEILNILDQCGNDISAVSESSENGNKRVGFQPQNAMNSDCKIGGIIFAPHRSGYFGIKDVKGKGILNRIQLSMPKKKVGYFMGSSDNLNADNVDKESTANQVGFINNELQLLVATKAFGMGIDKPNVGYTIHFNYPNSIESFVQESGRAGRDRKASMCYLLFNDQTLITKKGEEREVDKNILLFFHHASFKGEEKEMQVLIELLMKITHPKQKFLDELTEKLQEEYGFEHIKLNPNKKDVNQIYVNNIAGGGYGGFNLSNFTPFVFHKDFGKDISSFELSRLQPVLIELMVAYPDKAAKMNEDKQSLPEDGIEKRLAPLSIGDKITVTIHFKNDIDYFAKRIANVFMEDISWKVEGNIINKILTGMVNGAKKTELTFENFVEKLNDNDEFRIAKGDWNKCMTDCFSTDETAHVDFEKKVSRQLMYIRTENDTYKAVYRLSILGIVDDYEVDYNANTITLYITKKDDSLYFDLEKVNEPKYINHLFRYLNQYNSQKKTIEDLKMIQNVEFDTPTNIQRMLKFLLQFVYTQIAQKRLRGIEDMRLACQIGLNENGGQELKEFIDLYFNSKYARPEYEIDGKNYSLRVDTEGDKIDDLALTDKYIEATEIDKGGEKNNLKHLRGASLLLMRDIKNAERATLHLLQAYTLFILEYRNEKLLAEAQTSYLKGFINLYNTEGNKHLVPEKFVKYILTFNEKVRAKFQNTALIDPILDELVHTFYLKIHITWLKNFNVKHL